MSSPATSAPAEYDGPAFTDHDKQYLLVALGLGILTAIEVYLSYSPLKDKKAGLALPLLALAAIKFVIVAGFFMHLKFESPLFRRLFVGGAILAGFCYLAVLSAFGVLSGPVHWVIYIVASIVMLAVWVFRGGGVDAPADGHAADGHAAH